MKLMNLLMGSLLLTVSCQYQTSETFSTIKVTDIAHTPVKRQSIGNCWIYATATWAESLHLQATSEQVNLSESYWTYWDFYTKVLNLESFYDEFENIEKPSEISSGGEWSEAVKIIKTYGYMNEGDFIPSELDSEMSLKQSQAFKLVNKELKVGGRLAKKENRTPEKIIEVLNEGFGVNIDELKPFVHQASELITAISDLGEPITLLSSISKDNVYGWKEVKYPLTYNPSGASNFSYKAKRLLILKEVLKALNEYKPVMMNIFIDFNAQDTKDNGSFKYSTLELAGKAGDQGYHLVVLEDYVVDNVPDGQGGYFSIEENDASLELKEKALLGDVRYLKAKNSWGSSRPDRGMIDGYTDFYIEYLNRPILKKSTNDFFPDYYENSLMSFILPNNEI